MFGCPTKRMGECRDDDSDPDQSVHNGSRHLFTITLNTGTATLHAGLGSESSSSTWCLWCIFLLFQLKTVLWKQKGYYSSGLLACVALGNRDFVMFTFSREHTTETFTLSLPLDWMSPPQINIFMILISPVNALNYQGVKAPQQQIWYLDCITLCI